MMYTEPLSKKYGKKNFIKETLAIYETEVGMNRAEFKIIEAYLNHPLCYNLGSGGPTPNRGRKLSVKQVEKIKQANFGRPKSAEEVERIRVAMSGRTLSAAHVEKLRANRLGKTLSEEWKQKIREGM